MQVKLQNLVFLVLLPVLLIATAIFGWLIYRETYAVIIEGFDRKLSAVSTATGVFVDAAEHAELLRRSHRIEGLAYDAEGQVLYGIDTHRSRLVSIDPATGQARDIAPIRFPAGRGLAFVPERGALLTVSQGSGELFSVDPVSGAATVALGKQPGWRGLAFDPRSGTIYASDGVLKRIDLATGLTTTVLTDSAPEIGAIAVDARSNTLYGVAADNGQLLALDLGGGTFRVVGDLYDNMAVDSGNLAGPITALTFVPEHGKLFAASDRLVEIDPDLVGAHLAAPLPNRSTFPVAFEAQLEPIYRRYVGALRTIRNKRGLTYLYTQRLFPEGQIAYVLDGSRGSDHSPIGDRDLIPTEEVAGATGVLAEGVVHLSDILPWERWGLLKSAFAPIFAHNGEVVAMAGADVNVSVIDLKTRVALAKVGLAAVLTVLLAGLVSLWVARQLGTPLAQLKEGALRVAAGEYGLQIQSPALSELRQLTGTFNIMSSNLAATVRRFKEQGDTADAQRRRRELELVLAAGDIDPEGLAPELRVTWIGQDRPSRDPSGYLPFEASSGGQLLVWFAQPCTDPLAALRQRREVSRVAAQLFAKEGADWGCLRRFTHWFGNGVYCLVLLDPRNGIVHCQAQRPMPALILDATEPPQVLDLAAQPRLVIPAGQTLVLCSSLTLAEAERSRMATELLSGVAVETAGRTDQELLLIALRGGAEQSASSVAVGG